MRDKNTDSIPVRMETGRVLGVFGEGDAAGQRVDLRGRLRQRGHKKKNGKTVRDFPEKDSSFSRRVFSGQQGEGLARRHFEVEKGGRQKLPASYVTAFLRPEGGSRPAGTIR